MEKSLVKISIVIPTYNEEKIIGSTLTHLAKYLPGAEIIVVDGGSQDRTKQIVSDQFPAIKLIEMDGKGRGLQMNKGASSAKGELLFFLHADTFPPTDAHRRISDLFDKKEVVAASFFLKFDLRSWPYLIMSQLSKWNTTLATYGDQGLIVRKAVFEEIGGFHPFPIFEDVEIQRRLRKKGRFVKINRAVTTSARRFEKKGIFRQLLLNTGLILAWKVGLSVNKLSRFYTYNK